MVIHYIYANTVMICLNQMINELPVTLSKLAIMTFNSSDITDTMIVYDLAILRKSVHIEKT